MPTQKQRREAARRKLERQLQARIARERRRKRILSSLTAVVVIAAVVLVVAVVLATRPDKKKSTGSSSGSTSSSKSALPSRKAKAITRAAKTSTGPCKYKETAAALKSGNLFDTGLPPDKSPTPTSVYTVVFATNQGNITVQLNGKLAPCNVQSIVYLIGKKFYDNTACPRSVNQGIFVVQCGDPSGTTAGGPSYTVKDENLTKATTYPVGTLAMANSGANTNGSQFFFITKDSTSGLKQTGTVAKYTVIGKVTAGLAVLQKVAAGGDDGSNQAGGGRPNLDLIFKTVRVTKTAA